MFDSTWPCDTRKNYSHQKLAQLDELANNQSSISHQFEKAILSEKDLKHACLKDAVLDFDINDKLY